jgi:hypothetical protein
VIAAGQRLTGHRFALIGGAAHVAVALVLIAPVWWSLHTLWPAYDDEGYLTLSLRRFVEGGDLYEQVFTQYGPAYYLLWGALVEPLGVEVTMNTGRLLVVAVWITASLLGAVAVTALTRNLLAGLTAQIALFAVLTGLVSEPMHPSGLIVLLLSAFAAVAALGLPRRPVPTAAVLGAIAAAVALTKLNVGGLLGLGALLAVALLAPGRRQALVAAAAAGAAALVPFVLMAPDLSDPQVARLALVVAIASLALGAASVLAPQTGPGGALLRRLGVAFLGAGALAALVLLTAIVLLGSAPGAVWEGVVADASRLRDVFFIRPGTAPNHVLWALVGLATAIGWAGVRRRPGADRPQLVAAGAAARISIAVLGLVALTAGGPFDTAASRLAFPLAFTWLVLLPPRMARAPRELVLPRTLLAACGVLQVLQIYPVAGTQVSFAGVLLAVPMAVVLADGLAEVRAVAPARAALPALAVAAGTAVLAGFAWTQVVDPWAAKRDAYQAGRALPFYGANRVRLEPGLTATLDALVQDVRRRCDTVIGYPGFGSLHLWSGVPAPNGLMPGFWTGLLDADQQQQVVDDARRRARVCVVRNSGQALIWTRGAPPPRRPLVRYVEGFRTVSTYGPWELQVPARRATGA